MRKELIDKALEASGVPRGDRYTIKQTQIIIGASIETIRRMLRSGILKGQRVGRKWLYIYHDEIEKLLNHNIQ